MDMSDFDHHAPIFGTTIFDGEMAMKGYPLNKMCYSFNRKDNRDEFAADSEAYMEKYGLSEKQKQAVRDKNVLKMIEEGGNIYYLAKLAGILGLNVQDLGALQTGMSVDDFKAALLDHATTETRVADDERIVA